MVKIWLWNKNIDMILFHSDTCTQKYVEENYQLIAETDEEIAEAVKEAIEEFAE